MDGISAVCYYTFACSYNHYLIFFLIENILNGIDAFFSNYLEFF